MVQMMLPKPKYNNAGRTDESGKSVAMKRRMGARGSFVKAGREWFPKVNWSRARMKM